MSTIDGLLYLIKLTLTATILQWLLLALSLATLWLVIAFMVALFGRVWRRLTWRR